MSDVSTPPDIASPPTHLFGELARELGLIGAEQIETALRAQREADSVGNPWRKIGEIFIERRELEHRSVQKILLEQTRRREKQGTPVLVAQRQIGHFEILAVLGSGGMGHVYKARDTVQDRIVALKILSLRLSDDTEFVARFKREVEASSSLSNPNIVAGISSGSLEGRPYLTMEFVDGRSLGKIIDTEGRLPERRALLIAREVARALDYAHAHGVVHRDVKPDNVLMGSDGAIKLTDFGLAKVLRDNQRLTQSGIALGTPHYISPEQVEASRYIDHRADLYSLGTMLFQMLTGKVPFEGENNNEIMLKHIHETARDPRDIVPEIQSSTVLIVKKLMAKKAADRYDSAALLIEDLSLLLKGQKPLHAVHHSRSVVVREKSGCAAIFLLFFAAILYLAN